jgi:fructosamine-3-kinase
MNATAIALARAAGDEEGIALAAPRLQPLGSAHGVDRYRLTATSRDGQRDYFVKQAERKHAAALAAEADGLLALGQSGAVRVPRVLAEVAVGEDRQALISEWLPLLPLGSASARRLGVQLAALHRRQGERFGWARDNFIGGTPQCNDWHADWLTFLQLRRLQPQLRLAALRGYPTRMLDRGERLLADCPALFACHTPRPSLLHGDLWPGNAAALPDGTPVVYDPACYYGDRETDLAMSELFGGMPPDFQAAYREASPLADGYPVRRHLYNLYHWLNHANLFAGDYVSTCADVIDQVLAQL